MCPRHLGARLGRFRNIFRHVGDKMTSKRDKMATKRANMSENEARDSCKCSAGVVILLRAEGVGAPINKAKQSSR